MGISRLCYTLPLIVFVACFRQQEEKAPETRLKDTSDTKQDTLNVQILPDKGTVNSTALEQRLIAAGLVNVQQIDSTIAVDLRYSTEDNFLGEDVYGDFDKCYLQPDVAEKLILAQSFLKSKIPAYRLVIFDAVRPRSIQQRMWDMLDVPIGERIKYVSNPKLGSLHNFGAAVDVSILDESGEELDMGTPFDHFGELAFPTKEKQMLEEGKLTEEQIANRKLLREVMQKAGFFNIQTEWWHFNSCYRKEAKTKYSIVE